MTEEYQMIVPHSIESEEALLGACLINPSEIEYLNLTSEEFYIHRNGWIWSAMKKLISIGEPVDFVTLTEELDKADHLVDLGGSAYLMKIMNSVPSSLHAAAYAKRVKETATRRQMITRANNLAKLAYDEQIGVEEALQTHTEEIGKMRIGVSDRMKSSAAVSDEFAERIRAGDISVKWNIAGMDNATGGKERETLTVVAARPGMGKTAFILQAARCDALNNLRVGVFELEMGAISVWARFACPAIGVSWRDVIAGRLTEDQEEQLIAKSKEVAAQYPNLLIDDTAGMTTAQIYQKTVENNLDIVYIDHLWLLGDNDKSNSEVKRLGDMCMRLKNMAKTLSIPVVLLVQLSRGVDQRKNKVPTLSDLRDSGKIEEAADNVLMLYRQGYYDDTDESVTEMWIRKFRNGLSNVAVDMNFNAKNQWFDSPEDEEDKVKIPDYIHD